ncbi:hypothetical protein IEQ34_010748 [Dendrobium chrysotoxum]|uniref:Uncharacterized protein n=1 Tax=Dendrobium chrysotoxum TaxID=161865 RepID=A0AAV7GXX4_DENCH|nr:hypothetical protein IEQ34_010748 [Dendrobium chrysotoxum]
MSQNNLLFCSTHFLCSRNYWLTLTPHELPHLLNQLPAVSYPRKYIEAVNSLRELQDRHLLPPRPQPLAVQPLPILQRVEAADHHHGRRKILLDLRPILRPQYIDRLMIPILSCRQKRSPEPIRSLRRYNRRSSEPDLRFRPFLPSVKGLDLDNA